MKPLFSVCLIGKNEEKTLPRLLESLKEFRERGGEIVYVDTNSSDNTAQVAKDYGCIVFEEGDRFRVYLTDEQVKEINETFIVEGELAIVKDGDSLFDYSSARNYAASLAKNDWVWQPDCDEVFTSFDIDKINEAIVDKEVSILEYDFVFSHLPDGSPAIAFLHSKCYNKTKYAWRGIVHEILSRI